MSHQDDMPGIVQGTTGTDAWAAARLLGIEQGELPLFERFRNGLRSRAVLATMPHVDHRFRPPHDRVVIKLYKGKGDTDGSLEYQRYHHTDFSSIPALVALADDGRIQRSLSGGRREGVGPYAILTFLEGEELTDVLERADLDGAGAERLVHGLLTHLWIPIWSAGLRFKDCHPGNFVVAPDGRLAMIDTEQMRKPAREWLETPAIWTRRDAAERTALRRLPGLLQRIVLAAAPAQPAAAVRREVCSTLEEVGLPAALHDLDRDAEAPPRAHAAVAAMIAGLQSHGWLA